MTETEMLDTDRQTRRGVYAILIFVALGIGFGKIASVDNANDRAVQNLRLAQLNEKLSKVETSEEREKLVQKELPNALKARPTLSANDRSRWLTIRALVEKDARVYRYVPDYTEAQRARIMEERKVDPRYRAVAVADEFRYTPEEILRNCSYDCPEKYAKENLKEKKYRRRLVPYAIDKAWETPGWDSIDVVKHGLKDEIWDPTNPSSGYVYSSKPTLLPTVMAAPYWVLNRHFGLSLAKKPFETARILLVIYNLIPFGIALLCLASSIELVGRDGWSRVLAFASVAFASGMLTFVATLNNHLPGFACVSIMLWAFLKITRAGEKKARYFFLAGFFGAFSVACDLPSLAIAGLICAFLLWTSPKKTILISIPSGLIVAAAFFATNYVAHESFIPAYEHKRDHMALEAQMDAEIAFAAGATAETVESVTAEHADPTDWYYYKYYPSGRPRAARYAIWSHWIRRVGIDRGEASRTTYALRSTIGSRGVFSLTPVWALGLFGAICLAYSRFIDDDRKIATSDHALSSLGVVLTIVFFAFFFTRPQGDRSYGGVSSFPRWFFPLAPIYAICMTAALAKFSGCKVLRLIAYLALFWSVVSAFYPSWNPWTDPWLYQYAVEWGWTKPF